MRRLHTLCIALVLLMVAPGFAFAAPMRIDTATIAQADPDLDGVVIVFTGEAIGDSLRAPAGQRWVNVLEGATAVGVVADPELFAGIDGFGEWSRTGTRVEVTGVLNIACTQHGGDLDVHASEVRVLAPSEPVERPISPEKGVAALGALALALVLVLRFRAVRARDF